MLDSTIAYGLDFLFPAGDTAVGHALKTSGEFSRVELDFMLSVAGEAGTLIDVGANIGSIALPFAAAKPGWRVTAIEASRALAGVLSANTLNNRLYNVTVVHAGAGATRGLVDYPAVTIATKGNFGSLGFGQDQGRIETVPMLTLDELADGRERLIKLDVEGFEIEVLKGATALLDRREAVWVFEASQAKPNATRDVAAAFLMRGYRLFWLFVPFATPASAKAPPAKLLEGDLNIVAMPPGKDHGWDLVEILDDRIEKPAAITVFSYLTRYGYRFA